jgi:predicted Fe-S protein YdhL (DUF1289 family)
MYVTPCISVCKIDKDTRICMGCKRTIDEISNWSRYSDEERNKIMKRLGYGRRKGGRDKNVTKR